MTISVRFMNELPSPGERWLTDCDSDPKNSIELSRVAMDFAAAGREKRRWMPLRPPQGAGLPLVSCRVIVVTEPIIRPQEAPQPKIVRRERRKPGPDAFAGPPGAAGIVGRSEAVAIE